MAEKKQQEFVVSDRRRFAPEGDLRTDAPVVEEERPAAPPATPPSPPPAAKEPEAQASPEPESTEMAPPPTAQEEKEQSDAYKASGKKLDEMFTQAPGGKQRVPAEMTF